MKRAWYILAMAAALAWGAREAQALVIGVQATWNIPGVSLHEGSIVQVVAYNSGEGRDPTENATEPGANFITYSSGDSPVYLPDTVNPALKHEIVYTGHVSESGGQFVFKEFINIDPAYDRIYIRIFETDAFTVGTASESGWGISEVQAITTEAGLGFSWFEDVPLTNTNLFEVIPEPGTAWLLLCGLGGVACAGWRRRNGVDRSGKTGDGKR